MRDEVTSMLKPVLLASCALLAIAAAAFAEPVDPAQAIAQKFSEDGAAKPAAVPDRPSLDYEMDMLRRARAEELERQEETATPKPAAPVKAGAPNPTKPASPPSQTAAAPALPPQPAPTAPMPQPAPATPVSQLVPAPTTSPAQTAQQPSAVAPVAEAKPSETAEKSVKSGVPPTAAPSPPPRAEAKVLQPASDNAATRRPDPQGPRATILVVLDGNDTDQAAAKPDPIICFDQQCWVSGGLDAPARPMARTAAVALKSTDGVTGDSCDGKSACAFRDVALTADMPIEVVEVGESRGVADGAYSITADKSCRSEGGDLVCGDPLVTHAFRMWVVPEKLAQQVGAGKLEDAVVNGLPDADDDGSASNDK